MDAPLTELHRRIRVVEQMLTAHAVLQRRLERRSALADLATLGLSILLCLLTFVDSGLLRSIGVGDNIVRIILGMASALVFFMSLVQIRVDWKSRAARHEKAVATLGRLRASYRHAKREFDLSAENAVIQSALGRGDLVIEEVAPIPDDQFALLKALHNKKVLQSRLLDRFPAASMTAFRVVLWWRHTWRALRTDDSSSTGDTGD